MTSLNPLLGTWHFTMHHVARTEPITGRITYEPTLDGAFVLQTWTYDDPDFPDALSLFSDDSCSYFDVRGITRVFDFSIDETGWSLIRLDEQFSQRTVGRFLSADEMESSGEASEDGGVTWRHDFRMVCHRQP